MDFKHIQELIKIVNKSNIGELSIEEKDFKITIKQLEEPAPVFASQSFAPQQFQAPMHQVSAPAAVAAPAPAAAETAPAASNLIAIKSPMIGTFYRSAGPDKPNFMNVGDEVNIGDTVCIIEAMKLFNEIESEIKGKIVKMLVDNASPVEYDQPLFLVEPA